MNDALKKLVMLRKEKKLSTSQVAMIAGLDEKEYEQIESGVIKADLNVLNNLAKFYGVNLEETAEEKEEIKKPVKVASDRLALGMNLAFLIIAILSIVWFFFIPIGTFNVYGISGEVLLLNLLSVSNLGISTVTIIMLSTLAFGLIDSILLLALPKLTNSTYNKISSITKYVFSTYELAVLIYLLVVANGMNIIGGIILAVLWGIDMVAKFVYVLISFVKTKSNVAKIKSNVVKVKKPKQPLLIALYVVVSLCILLSGVLVYDSVYLITYAVSEMAPIMLFISPISFILPLLSIIYLHKKIHWLNILSSITYIVITILLAIEFGLIGTSILSFLVILVVPIAYLVLSLIYSKRHN